MEKRPPRTLGGPHTTFWEYCNRSEFRLQRCGDCHGYLWPPSPVCDDCLSDNLSWEPMSGRGKIVSNCTFHRQYYRECEPPWDVILIELAEGPRFVSNPKDIPREGVHEGAEVRVAFIACEDKHGQFRLPVFEAAS
jgi:uncharacterized protein